MKKKLLILPVALLGLILSSCGSNGLKDNFTEADQEIDTPWTDYVMPANGIEFADGEESITLQKGETHTYQYTILPRGATANSLNWFTYDENVATVDKGVVTAVGGGQTTITASSPENAFDPVELSVNVVVPLKDFLLTIPEKMDWEGQYRLEATYDPADTTEKELKYEISESSVENLVSISEQGVVTTYKQNGTAKLKVTGGQNIVKEYTLTVNSISVNSVTIADAGHELEVNHTLKIEAAVSPLDARDLATSGVKYYSKNPEIATVDETSGLVTGVATGNTSIYAQCGEVKSADYAIEVYRVNATSVNITTADFTLSNAEQGELNKQLAYTLTLDRAGHEEPSAANILFVSSNERVATVDENGLVTATGPGTAEISIQVVQEGLAILEDSVNVTVNIVSTALAITGGNSFYNDGTLTLTAVLTPANVSNSDVSWSVSPENIVSLSTTVGASVTLTPVNNDATGEVTVTATNINGASNTLKVTVNERPSLFTAGHHYIVGNALYNTGESVRVDGKSSWTTAKYAYEFSYAINDPSVYEQYKGTIKFQAGDQFKYFIGADYWVPAYEVFGENRGYHIEQEGENNAFSKGQVRFVEENESHEFVASDAPDANIEVVEAGWYDLYAKLYKNEDGSNWYSLYIEKVPSLSVEVNEITMGLEESYQIKAHDWIGNLIYSIKSGEDLITLSATGLVTGKGVAGTAVVTVNDDRNVPVDVTFTLQAGAVAGKTIYLNANGMFDTGNVVPFIHSWGAEGASEAADVMMNKVEGQNIVYSATIPLDHLKVDFVRCPEGSTSINWDNIYNQSKDQDIPTDGKDLFTMTGWSDEQDNSHRTYLNGEWSIFDSTHIYEIDSGSGEQGQEQGQEDPHGDSYIMYGNNPTWNYLELVENPGNPDEMMGSLNLEANTEFVIKMGNDDWRHFDNNKAASSNKIVQGSETEEGSGLYNFKASVDGVYSFYILEDKQADEGKTVYVGYTSTGGETTPNVVKLYFADVFNWANEENKMFAYAWGQQGNKVAWPGEEAEYVGLDAADHKAYTFDVDINLYDHIIFHVGDNKTQDIDISSAVDNQGYKPVDPAEINNGAYAVEPYVYTPKGDAPATYTVSFDANGGTGSKASVEGINGAYTLPDSTGLTAPDGKVFAGWALSATGEIITTATIEVTEDTVLYAIWEDQAVPTPNEVTLYLTANWTGWESPKAYAYNQTSGAEKAQWPGEAMSYVGVNDDNDTILSYTVDINQYDRIIFNNGDKETVSIDISAATNADAYYLNEYNGEGKIEVANWDHQFSNADLTSKQIVYFTNNKNWNDIKFYVFNSSTHAEANAWPGNDAKWVCNNEHSQGVYRLLIDTTAYDAFIFNGSGGQTIDILLSSLTDDNNAFYLLDTQDGSGHYEVGQWKY